MDQVILEQLHTQGILGVHARERTAPREILVSLSLETDTRKAGSTDDIADCVDYSVLARGVRELVARSSYFTIEALAESIARHCLDNPLVSRVLVKVEKPGAVAGCGSVGIEIERP
jgi:FolB domain-containing protein